MPSTTRGSILISTANDIGEALVEKLGGVGYSPNEWKDKFNLCGIAPVDSAPALSVLSDSAGTGDERGSILIATADAIGAILNKKYNVLRGFKPKEWASACRKMKALEEGSVASASIASFSDGADDVPTKSLVVTIPPTLTGKSLVSVVNEGNLCDFDNCNVEANTNTTVPLGADLTLKKGTYTLAFNISDTVTATRNRPCYVINGNYTYADSDYKTSGRYSWTFTLADDTTLSIRWWAHTLSANITISDFMLTYGSTAHAYEPYQTPTQYTASLGRTIYGGQVDIVNGTEKSEYGNIDMGTLTWQYDSANTRFFTVGLTGVIKRGTSGWLTDLAVSSPYTVASGTANDKTISEYASTGYVYIKDTDYTDPTAFKTSLSGKYLTYPLATPTDFTFTGQEINTRLGYNAFWSDSGDTAVEYYQAPTPYTRKTATGGIANFSDQRTDLPLTKAIANIAPSVAGKSAVNLYQGSEQYQPPTTYTADLGETVYGGSVDFVSGEVKKTHGSLDMGSLSWTYHAASGSLSAYFDTYLPSDAKVGNNQVAFDGVSENYTSIPSSQIALSGHDDMVMALGNDTRRFFLCDQRYTNADDLKNALNGETLAYPLTTPIESEIPGRVISPIEGVNNYWNDAGGDTEIQYFEDET